MINRVILEGRLATDIELRTTNSGAMVATFTLAVPRQFKNADGEWQTDFVPIVVWRELATRCAQYLDKGKLAGIDGQLRIRRYDAKNGSKITVTEIYADSVSFLSPKNKEANEISPVIDTTGEEETPIDKVPF